MNLSSLIDPEKANNSGGVAGRLGYDFQAHVAAAFVLEMIANSSLLQVECETADDVTLRWNRNGRDEIEYVQVKSTDDDSKWSIQELVSRKKSRVGSSLMEKSLACDAFPGHASFRFVSTRDVRGELVLFKIPRENRDPSSERFQALVLSFSKKWKNFKSAQGRTTKDWAENLFWNVENSEEDLERKNVLALLRLAENAGERPSSSLSQDAYDSLLLWVSDASKKSRVTEPQLKVVSSICASKWWTGWLRKMAEEGQRSLKVYSATPDEFLVLFRKIDEPTINRSLKAFDAEFDGGEWRQDDLAEYLANFLPEVTLPPKVLASFTHLQARELIQRSVDEVHASGHVELDRLLAELMLNAVLRLYYDSEPIACKLFTRASGVVHTNSAHIVHAPGGDEVWLGQARLVAADCYDDILSEILSQIEDTLKRDVLKKERKMIIQLRHPDHLKASNIEKLFSNTAKLDDFLQILTVPILIAYDSSIISQGEESDYLEKLAVEVHNQYEEIKSQMPAVLKDIRVQVFLIPIECAVSLLDRFGERIGGK